MKKTGVAVASGAGGLTIGGGFGYAISKLSSTDLRALLEKFTDGLFEFLRNQGPYTAFVIAVTVVSTVLFVWVINKLIQAKQGEIDRLVQERDRFQKPFIQHWQSTRRGKNK